jgi:hypothetical protein
MSKIDAFRFSPQADSIDCSAIPNQ